MTQQPSKIMPAIWGGVLIGVLSGVPGLNLINCMCCAGVMAGGVLAVYLFRKDVDPTRPVSMADGAALGLLAGVFGAIIGGVLDAIFSTASLSFLYRIAEYSNNPEFQDMLNQFGPQVLTQGLFILSFLTKLIVSCIFGLIGGLLGVSFFGKATQEPEEVEPAT